MTDHLRCRICALTVGWDGDDQLADRARAADPEPTNRDYYALGVAGLRGWRHIAVDRKGESRFLAGDDSNHEPVVGFVLQVAA